MHSTSPRGPGLRLLPCLTLFAAVALPAPAQTPTASLTLPAFTGYAHPDPDKMERRDDGTVPRCDGQLVFYVQTATKGELQLSLARTANASATSIVTTIGENPGDDFATTTTPATASDAAAEIELGTFELQRAGYHRITLATSDGSALTNLQSLRLRGPAARNAHANTIERRNAASIHLGYDVPAAHRDDIEWFYCEVTPRTDPLCTYYMATGFRRGYFGMQDNSPTERRIIFSVWDAGDEGVDRKHVAAADQVQLLAKGDGVHADGFGHEGTGGHSHLVHDWHLGDTFRFLLHAEPDSDHTHTTYTAWFWFAATKQWALIASFRAPKDGSYLHGLYSFSENFGGANGDALRECEFGNLWVRTKDREWFALDTAHFTHDGTGKAARLDRSAGVRGDRFFLRHGDFANPPAGSVTHSGDRLELPASKGQHPADDDLPGTTR